MDFKEAAAVQMPFGKHEGKTVDKIASTDEGLKYLDWLRGEREGIHAKKRGVPQRIDEALRVYLNDPLIQRELSKLKED